MFTLYGIKNCDTIKKARNWLESHDVDYQFHDYRVDGLEKALLEKFESKLGWDVMLNRRSTSWRQLSDEQKNDLDAEKALQLMQASPTLIKRPILDTGDQLIIGFKAEQYQSL